MHPRLKQLTEHWKELTTALGLLGAALTAVPGLVEKSNTWLAWFVTLPIWVQWLFAGIGIVLAIWLFASAMARRSRLLRPKRFLIETETPDQLIGREKDLRALIEACEKHRLLFLPGDSGSGKSALVRAGLVKTCQASESTSRLVPIYIDASLLPWEGGLESEIRRALKQLSTDQLKALGTDLPGSEQTLTAWIDGLKTDALRQLLIVIDQFDDYALRWRTHLIDEAGLVINAQTLKKKNRDWRMLARGIEKGRLAALFVSRDDMQWALTPVRFVEPAEKPPLPRLETQWVRELFERLTIDDGAGETVQNPSFGWQQLSERLQQDLARETGTVLAIQLVVAVEGLQHLRSLSPRDYLVQGGLTGLEQLHVKAEVEKAAHCGGLKLEPRKLLGALEHLLVSEDGLKSGITDQGALAAQLEFVDPNLLKPVVDHLVAERILRRHTAADGPAQLMLYHDFRARGIREAWLRENGSHALLRQHHLALGKALTWSQKWSALLSTSDQFRLVWARLRGRIRYGIYKRLAFLSMVRMLPLWLLLAAAATGIWQWRLFAQRQQAERCLVFGPGDEPSEFELEKWTQLAGMSEQARLHALQLGLIEQPENMERRAKWLVHAVIGLDPGGRIQQRIADEILLPVLEDTQNPHASNGAYQAVIQLLDIPQPQKIAAALLQQIEVGKFKRPDIFGNELVAISENLDAETLRTAQVVLVNQMKGAACSYTLGGVIVKLSERLEKDELQPAAALIVNRMKGATTDWELAYLGSTLGEMSEKLEPDDLKTGALILIERMKNAKCGEDFMVLLGAFGKLSKKLNAKDLQLWASIMTDRINVEPKCFRSAFANSQYLLEAENLRPMYILLEQMNDNLNTDSSRDFKRILTQIRLELNSMVPEKKIGLQADHGVDGDSISSYGYLAEELKNLRRIMDQHEWQVTENYLSKTIKSLLKEDVTAWGYILAMKSNLESVFKNDIEDKFSKIRLGIMHFQDTLGKLEKAGHLVDALLPLYKHLEPNFATRMGVLIDVLQDPKSLNAHGAILQHLESCDEVAPVKFSGKVSNLVHWLETSEQGKALNLNLDFRPH